MTSILTNSGAMVALATLRTTTDALAATQSEISTGLTVATAKDNAAVWAISEKLRSDVQGYQAISTSLNLAEATVSVARTGAERVADLMTEIKALVVSAQGENLDHDKIQANIAALRDQISDVVQSADFNGQNLLTNTDTAEGSGSVDVLGALSRQADGTVSAMNIPIQKHDLTTGTAILGTTGLQLGTGDIIGSGGTGGMATFLDSAAGTFTAGNTFRTRAHPGHPLGDVVYVSQDGDTLEDVVDQLVMRFNAKSLEVDGNLVFRATGVPGEIEFDNNHDGNSRFLTGRVRQSAVDGSEADGTVGGRLELLGDIDVTSQSGRGAGLYMIEGLTEIAIDAAAYFGSVQNRLEIQQTFVFGLADAITSGIGTLVDADMKAAAARNQALQVQQQLSVQALSIANSRPESILALFG